MQAAETAAILDSLQRIEKRLAVKADHKLAYSIKEAAAACSCTESAITVALADGSLRAKKRGNKWIISRDALIEWLP